MDSVIACMTCGPVKSYKPGLTLRPIRVRICSTTPRPSPVGELGDRSEHLIGH